MNGQNPNPHFQTAQTATEVLANFYLRNVAASVYSRAKLVYANPNWKFSNPNPETRNPKPETQAKRMPFWIGTDEAGYGPNLGPLLVAATVWEGPPEASVDSLPALLAPISDSQWNPDAETLKAPLADSKELYQPGGSLAALEYGLLAALRIAGEQPSSWREIWKALAPRAEQEFTSSPWLADYNESLPLDAEPSVLQALSETFERGLQQADVRRRVIRATALFPAEFNNQVEQLQSKGGLLSLTTLKLIQPLLDSLPEGDVLIGCDKHGGRNQYAGFLQHVFGCWAETVIESRAQSIYRWGPPEKRVEIRFTAKGEAFPPAALASMTAKYLRELAMRAFNAFWRKEIPALRPTAGYPQDARRFKKEIEEVQKQLEIDDWILWRNR